MKISKFLERIILFSFLGFSFVFSACSSSGFLIPNGGNVTRQNIYNEYLKLGDTYFGLEKYTESIEYYNMAMQSPKLYWAAYYKLAKAYALTSNWANAQPMYEKLLQRDKENSSLKASLAYIYSMQGQTKKALDIYDFLLEEQPENSDFIENYIAISFSDEKIYKKHREKADCLFEKLKTDFPDNSNIKKLQEKFDELNPDLVKEEDSESDAGEEAGDSDETDSPADVPTGSALPETSDISPNQP